MEQYKPQECSDLFLYQIVEGRLGNLAKTFWYSINTGNSEQSCKPRMIRFVEIRPVDEIHIKHK